MFHASLTRSKAAAAEAAEDLDLADAQHHEIVAVAVDVQRVGADRVGQLEARAFLGELDRRRAGCDCDRTAPC